MYLAPFVGDWGWGSGLFFVLLEREGGGAGGWGWWMGWRMEDGEEGGSGGAVVGVVELKAGRNG